MGFYFWLLGQMVKDLMTKQSQPIAVNDTEQMCTPITATEFRVTQGEGWVEP